MNDGRGHQAPITFLITTTYLKAVHYLQKEVGQNIKHKKRGKRVRDEDPSWGESHERGEVPKYNETLSPAGLWRVLESQRAT